MTKSDSTLWTLSFFNSDYASLLSIINDSIEKHKNCFIVTPTTEIMGAAIKDAAVFDLLRQASILIPDSVTLVGLSRLFRKHIKYRLTGVDTLYQLGQSSQHQYSVFYLGTKPEILDKAIAKTATILPSFKVVGSQDGYFKPEATDEIIEKINASNADILFVGLGFPKQERFVADNLSKLDVPVKIAVGGSFDVLSGMIQRAPKWMQNLGLEWAWRLIQEPYRIVRMALIPVYLIQLFWLELFPKR